MNKMTDISCDKWLDRLIKEKKITDKNAIAESIILSIKKDNPVPIYLHIILGLGALLFMFFFVGFLGISGIISFRNEATILVWGVIFSFLALFIHKSSQSTPKNSTGYSFFSQLSFCFISTGKILFVVGFCELFRWRSVSEILLAMTIITLCTYQFYNIFLDRLTSSFAVFFSFNVWMWNEAHNEMTFFVVFISQLIGVAYLFTSTAVKVRYRPIAYALIISLITLICTVIVKDFLYHTIADQWIINVSLIFASIALLFRVMNGKKSEAFYLACVAFIFCGLISASGVLFAILLMILGYSQHDRFLLWIGYLFLPLYLCLYYYSLDVTLLHKSITLMVSGSSLLLGCLYIKFRGFHGELEQK